MRTRVAAVLVAGVLVAVPAAAQTGTAPQGVEEAPEEVPTPGESPAPEGSPAPDELPEPGGSPAPNEPPTREELQTPDESPAPEPTEGVQELVGEPSDLVGEPTELLSSTASIYGDIDGLIVTETPEGLELTTAADILFDFGSAELGPDAEGLLEETVEALLAPSPTTVEVVGHTDGIGSAAGNDRLSLARAEAVAAVLREHPRLAGITFTTVGVGSREPIAAEQDEEGADLPEGRARNRRVELRFSPG
jgi:OmpA-OmpF porin, OOP family